MGKSHHLPLSKTIRDAAVSLAKDQKRLFLQSGTKENQSESRNDTETWADGRLVRGIHDAGSNLSDFLGRATSDAPTYWSTQASWMDGKDPNILKGSAAMKDGHATFDFSIFKK